jgi:hypothetical protein
MRKGCPSDVRLTIMPREASSVFGNVAPGTR